MKFTNNPVRALLDSLSARRSSKPTKPAHGPTSSASTTSLLSFSPPKKPASNPTLPLPDAETSLSNLQIPSHAPADRAAPPSRASIEIPERDGSPSGFRQDSSASVASAASAVSRTSGASAQPPAKRIAAVSPREGEKEPVAVASPRGGEEGKKERVSVESGAGGETGKKRERKGGKRGSESGSGKERVLKGKMNSEPKLPAVVEPGKTSSKAVVVEKSQQRQFDRKDSVGAHATVNQQQQQQQSQSPPKRMVKQEQQQTARSVQQVQGNVFNVKRKYKLNRLLGTGAYGVVCSGEDTESSKPVAVKKIFDAFADLEDAKRILRELMLLRSIDHENIISALDVDMVDDNDVYVITNLMDADLSKVLHSGIQLLPEQRKFFVYQIARALKYLHSANIIHRDLKPANLLVDENCDLRVCDFGLARHTGAEEDDAKKTVYVCTRYYRAPEIMLSKQYDAPVDMWSLGCILAEMYIGRPLFDGKDFVAQVDLMLDTLGRPSEEDLVHISDKKARKYIQNSPIIPGRTLQHIFRDIEPEALDLLTKLLQFNPAKRLTAAQVLEHPFVRDFHDPADEPLAPPSLATADLEPLRGEKLTKERLQDLVRKEAQVYGNCLPPVF